MTHNLSVRYHADMTTIYKVYVFISTINKCNIVWCGMKLTAWRVVSMWSCPHCWGPVIGPGLIKIVSEILCPTTHSVFEITINFTSTYKYIKKSKQGNDHYYLYAYGILRFSSAIKTVTSLLRHITNTINIENINERPQMRTSSLF